ncbi:MAG TPA: hypothetical protein VFH15_11510 [Pyrinomonadaceae bacterium]|nr:hypothetical protein [Pyrinomonadaceae bacterium]
MPKCLHPPCPNQVADALYCDEHRYIPHWTTNVEQPRVSIDTGDWPTYAPSVPQSAPSAPRSAPRPAPILVLALLVLILAILAVGMIVILKLVF